MRRSVALLVVLGLAGSLLVAAAPLASATHDVSHPQPSVPNCEWYGSVKVRHEFHDVHPDTGATNDVVDVSNGWSGPSPDSICRGKVFNSYHQRTTDGSGGWVNRDAEGTVSATYEVQESPGRLSVFFYGDESIPHVVTDSDGGHTEGEGATGAHGACEVPGIDTDGEMAALQAFVVTCTDSQIEANFSQTWSTEIRMRRTVCDKSVDTDGDNLADCTEFALQTDPSNPDTDGDGLSDGAEVLHYSTDPRDVDTDNGGVPDGMEVGNGTNPKDPIDDDPVDCDVDTPRGFVRAHYDADLDVAAAPDPDFFDWDVTAGWCVKDGLVTVLSEDQYGSVTLGTTLATGLDLFGVTFREDLKYPARFVESTAGTTGAVSASTDFDVCVKPFTLLFNGASRLVKRLVGPILEDAIGSMPRSTSVSAWLDKVTLRVDQAFYTIEHRLLTRLDRKLDDSSFRALPDSVEEKLRKGVKRQVRDLEEAIKDKIGGSWRKWMRGGDGFNRFLDVYHDGGRIYIRRGHLEEARKLWKNVLGDVVDNMIGLVIDAINVKICLTVWRPTLTIFIPKFGESFVDDAYVDRSVFDVKGGIAADIRSTNS